MSIPKNIQSVQENFKSITDRPITLVAVTKNRTVEEIQEAIEAGISHIGENRWQEAKDKLPELPTGITRHFIGHLQSKKVKDVVQHFDMIQSVDSLKLAEKINKNCEKIGKTMPILIQVNTSDEPQKGGVTPKQTDELIRKIAKLPHLRVQGLMTLAIQSDDKNKVRNCFKVLKRLFDGINIPNVEMKWLSMGMSGDYEIAIEEGANMVRIGRKIFT